MINTITTARELADKQVREVFGNVAAVQFPAACRFMGIAGHTGLNWRKAGTFPLPTSKVNSKLILVPTVALTDWTEQMLVKAGYPAEAPPLDSPVVKQPARKSSRGRPSKQEELEAKTLGVSVKELRARGATA